MSQDTAHNDAIPDYWNLVSHASLDDSVAPEFGDWLKSLGVNHPGVIANNVVWNVAAKVARERAVADCYKAVKQGLFCGHSHDDILASLQDIRDGTTE